MGPTKVVVHYADGRIIKGYSQDFLPTNPSFHVQPLDSGDSTEAADILISDLKAVFFVWDFLGDPTFQERKEIYEGAKIIGEVLEVTFKDGERMVGSSLIYDPEKPGFFIFPADPEGNNLGVFVVSRAVSEVRHL